MTHPFNSYRASAQRLGSADAVIHVQFVGLSFDLLQSDLNVDLSSAEGEVKYAVARSLGISLLHLERYVVERDEAGDFSLEMRGR